MMPYRRALAAGRVRPGWSRRQLLTATGLATAVPALAACDGEPRPTRNGPPDRAVVRTRAGHDAYVRVAEERGFFADAGIEVTVEPGPAADDDDPYQRLAGGAAQFAIVDAAGAYQRYAAAGDPLVEGGDDGFQIVAAIQQEVMVGLVALDGTGVDAPPDLGGHTVGLPAGSLAETLWPAYAELTFGLDRWAVETVPTSPRRQAQQLLAGSLDAIGLDLVESPAVRAAADDRELVTLPYAHALPDLYGEVLIAPKRLLRDDPDLAHRFTAALLEGLVYALDNPDQARPEAAVAGLELMRDYVHGGLLPGEPVGFVDELRVVRGMALLTAAGVVSGGANHALGSASGGEGVVNFRFVPGVGAP